MIYIDIYFIINVLMNIWLLFLCSKIFGYDTSLLRMISGAVIGAIWALISLFISNISSIASFLFMLIISFLMCYVSYRLTEFKHRLLSWGRFLLVAWLMGGILNFLYFNTNLGGGIKQFLYGEGVVNGGTLFFYICIISVCIVGASGFYKYYKKREKPIVTVVMEFQNNKVEVLALVDSGNRLYLPQIESHNKQSEKSLLKHNAVSLIDEEIAKLLLGEEIGTSLIHYMTHMEQLTAQGILVHMIPFQSIGEAKGLLPAIRISSMTIQKDTGDKRIIEPLIGISPTKFSKDKEYKMILHPNI